MILSLSLSISLSSRERRSPKTHHPSAISAGDCKPKPRFSARRLREPERGNFFVGLIARRLIRTRSSLRFLSIIEIRSGSSAIRDLSSSCFPSPPSVPPFFASVCTLIAREKNCLAFAAVYGERVVVVYLVWIRANKFLG